MARVCRQAVGTIASTTHTNRVALWDCVDLGSLVAAVCPKLMVDTDDGGSRCSGRVLRAEGFVPAARIAATATCSRNA